MQEKVFRTERRIRIKFIAICESDLPITEEVEEELKNTIFVGNDYCFEITKIINDEVVSELKGE